MIKRYPCQAVIFFIFGILAAKGMAAQREAGPDSYGLLLTILAVMAAGASVPACMRAEPLKKKKLQQAVILLLAFGSGMTRMHAQAAAMESRSEGLSNGQKVTVQGKIVKKQSQETEYQAIPWTVCLTDSYLKTSQGIRSSGDIIAYIDLKSGEPVTGNTIIFTGKIKLFNEARNDGNFDERRYYQNQGYTCRIYGDKDSLQVVDENTDEVRECLYGLQQRLVKVYQRGMPQEEAGALCAMLLGEKSLLSNEIKQLYQQCGIAHILAISGLHISLLGMAVFRMLRNRGASYRTAAFVSMSLLALFGCMTGMGLSTIRAVVMFGIYLGAACCGRAYDSMNGLAAAAACLLLKNPASLFLAGFQFSFLAVAGVLFGKEVCRVFQPKYRLAETMLLSLSIQMLTLPLTAWHYFEIPIYSLLLNLLVLPLMGMVLLFGLFGGACGLLAAGALLSKGFLTGCTLLLGCFSKAGKLFLQLPAAVWVVGQPKAWQLAGYYAVLSICAVLLAKRQQKTAEKETVCSRHKMLAGLSCAACLSLLFVRLPKQAEVVILDVGQGDGIYIHTSDGLHVMIDGGSTDVKQAGTYRILPFLKSQGIAGIDYWFLSHLDQDHISGFQEIIESGYSVGEAVFSNGIVKDEAYEKMMQQLSDAQIKIRNLKKGDVLRGKHAGFRCLTPLDDNDSPSNDRNAKSLVLMYEDRDFLGFFSGDISKEEEQKLLAENDLPQVTLYKAAHHGSKHSNKEELLAQLKPAVSVVSCSEENDYGHPSKEAVANMEKYSKSLQYTMHSGQIRISMEKDGDIHLHLR